jgi:hypothetical protein
MMLHSPPGPASDRGVRDGQLAAVTCAACGCRLAVDQHDEAWYHFSGSSGRDARGCRVICVDSAHDRFGRAVSAA